MKYRLVTWTGLAVGLGAIALSAACGPSETGGGTSSSQASSVGAGGGGGEGNGSGGGGTGSAGTASTTASGTGGSGTGGNGTGGSGTGGSGTGGGGGGSAANSSGKIDVLFDIDNSRSMADKQAILSLVVNDFVQALVNPPCVDSNGAPSGQQPANGQAACPNGTTRAYAPITDIHLGVITSSIGGHGGDACPNQDNNTCAPNPNFTNNDKGHLINRQDPCGSSVLPTYADKGFLAWDPLAAQNPPGDSDAAALSGKFQDLVLGAGQIGCGYESQLESWYRFLVDPEPYESISVVANKATPSGIDQVLLTQRADFLRPDSLLAIFMLSDENDCSTKEYGQFFFANQLKNGNGTPFHLPRARAVCSVNPNDPCCRSCGQGLGNCPVDPTCLDANGNIKALTDLEDSSNIRCFDQKRRFGIDFLYPIERYTGALTALQVPNRAGDIVPNPIFSDLNPNDGNSTIRSPEHVFLAGVVGVPWQDLARDPADLAKGYKNADELAKPNAAGVTGWDIVVGDPASNIPPKDPHMIESIDPRAGTNPVTGTPIAPPGSPSGTNPINGHEYSLPQRDDLQYACIFDLPTPRDCSDPSISSCDCWNPQNDNPLCEENPGNPGSRTLQTRAKAYPGVRELSLLKSLGDQGVAASICPAQLDDPAAATYAYRPAVNALIERIKPVLPAATP